MEKILIGDSYPKHYIREPGSNLCTCHFYLIPLCTKEKKNGGTLIASDGFQL